MRAVQIVGVGQLAVAEVPIPVAGRGEVVVRIQAAALNHRDYWILQGQYAGIVYPCTPGSDGAGAVESVGPGVDPAVVGRSVIINPSFGWGHSAAAQGPEFSILGLPRAGTLAERIVVPVAQVSPVPGHLAWNEAAALPLAGLTAYRALFTRAGLRAGEKVLITGIGGGVSLIALQMAVAAGAEVSVTSSDPTKRARAAALGAVHGFDYTQPDWSRGAAAGGPYAVVLDGAGGPGFDALIDLAAPGARLVTYGATRGNPSALALRKVFWRQLSLLGSTMGSPDDWAAMLAFVTLHRIMPVVSSVHSLAEAAEAFRRMGRGEQFGKLVLTP